MDQITQRQLNLTSLMMERRAPITSHSVRVRNCPQSIQFSAYRCDLMGHYLSGNKILKMAPNIKECLEIISNQSTPIATFGGSTSNHLRAFSAATRMLRLNSVAFLRESPKNHHLPIQNLLEKRGCKVVLLSPLDFKERETNQFQEDLKRKHGNFRLIPEGGSSAASVRHLSNVFAPLKGKYSHVFVPVGLGGTIAGIALGLGKNTKIIGVSALKTDFSLTRRVKTLIASTKLPDPKNWEIDYNFHFGGFGKANAELKDFASCFEDQTSLQLYQTYTMKSAYALIDYCKRKQISSALWINTYNPY